MAGLPSTKKSPPRTRRAKHNRRPDMTWTKQPSKGEGEVCPRRLGFVFGHGKSRPPKHFWLIANTNLPPMPSNNSEGHLVKRANGATRFSPTPTHHIHIHTTHTIQTRTIRHHLIHHLLPYLPTIENQKRLEVVGSFEDGTGKIRKKGKNVETKKKRDNKSTDISTHKPTAALPATCRPSNHIARPTLAKI